MTIKQLPNDSSVSILSSSSIFSPVSAIKELVDNSIDSGASSITIEVDADTIGLNYLSVKDNGSGIDKSDRSEVCLKSTTSKVTTVDEINLNLNTLGFRGEALFFLANLACKNDRNGFGSLSIATKKQNEPIGEKWSVDSKGCIIKESVKKIPTAAGTAITIRGLFNSLPVRKKFLVKHRNQLMNRLKELVISYAFIYCHKIKFMLKYVKLNSKNEVSNTNVSNQGSNLVLNSNIDHFKLLTNLISIKNLKNQFIKQDNQVFLNENELKNVEASDTESLQSHKPIPETEYSWKVTYLLPIMKGENQIVTYNKPIKTLAINNKPLNISIGFGKKVSKLLSSIYTDRQLLSPNIWYLNILSPQLSPDDEGSTIRGDINIEPEKSDILLNNEELLLKKLGKYLEGEVEICHTDKSPLDKAALNDERYPIVKVGSAPQYRAPEIDIAPKINSRRTGAAVGDTEPEISKEPGEIDLPVPGVSQHPSNSGILTSNSNKSKPIANIGTDPDAYVDPDADANDWVFSMHDSDVSATTEFTSTGNQDPKAYNSSLLVNESNDEDSSQVYVDAEDRTLNKDISISDPFISAKLQHSLKQNSPEEDILANTISSTTISESKKKIQALDNSPSSSHSSVEYIDDTTQIITANNDNDFLKKKNDTHRLASSHKLSPLPVYHNASVNTQWHRNMNQHAHEEINDNDDEILFIESISKKLPISDSSSFEHGVQQPTGKKPFTRSVSATTIGTTNKNNNSHRSAKGSRKKLTIGSQYRKLDSLIENTHCYNFEHDVYDPLSNNAKHSFRFNYEQYEVDMLESEPIFRNFLLSQYKKVNPETLNGCKLKVVPKKQGWTYWKFI